MKLLCWERIEESATLLRTMTPVLQRVKDKRMTAAQDEESRVVFELATEGSDFMTVKQLKMCLRAMGFHVTRSEAQSLVYEFDYTNSNSIDLADFQKIFLSKMVGICERQSFNQAFSALSNNDTDQASIRELSTALSMIRTKDDAPHNSGMDEDLLRYQISLQYYDDQDVEAVQGFIDKKNTAAEGLCIPKAALAAFIRVKE